MSTTLNPLLMPGSVVQIQRTDSATAVSTTSAFSTPVTSSQGAAWGSVSITPKSAANRLIVTFKSPFYNNDKDSGPAVFMFKDAETSARAFGMSVVNSAEAGAFVNFVHFEYSMTAGTTSPITFAVRFGPWAIGTATTILNYDGYSGGAIGWGCLQVMEVAA